MKNTKKLVIGALMAALTCIATMIIKIPTPTLGYIHLGDGLVLLCGIVLGPLGGALSAGIGYASWAPATLIIKALTAFVAGFLFHRMQHRFNGNGAKYLSIILGGIIGEAVMVFGYFVYEAGLAALASGHFNSATLAAGIASSASGIPFNILQGVTGIVISLVLLPVLMKIEDAREWICA